MAQPRDYHGRWRSGGGGGGAKGKSSGGKSARGSFKKKKSTEAKAAAKASRLEKRLQTEAKVRRLNTTIRTIEGSINTGTRLHKKAKNFMDFTPDFRETANATKRSKEQVARYKSQKKHMKAAEIAAKKQKAANQKAFDTAKKEKAAKRLESTGRMLAPAKPKAVSAPSGKKKTPKTTTRSQGEANAAYAKTKAKSKPKSTNTRTVGQSQARGRTKRNIRAYRKVNPKVPSSGPLTPRKPKITDQSKPKPKKAKGTNPNRKGPDLIG